MDDKQKAALAAYADECKAASAVRGRKVVTVSNFPRYAIPTGTMLMGVFGNELKMLMGERGPTVAHPGTDGIPAGYPQDYNEETGVITMEDPAVTAQREIFEEVGLMLPLERLELIDANCTSQFLYGEPRLMHHTFFMAYVTQEEALKAKPDGKDLVRIFWNNLLEIEASHARFNVAISDSYMPPIRKAFTISEARLNGTYQVPKPYIIR